MEAQNKNYNNMESSGDEGQNYVKEGKSVKYDKQYDNSDCDKNAYQDYQQDIEVMEGGVMQADDDDDDLEQEEFEEAESEWGLDFFLWFFFQKEFKKYMFFF